MHSNPILLSYIPHGSDANRFYPIAESSSDFEAFSKFRDDFQKKWDSDFVILFNSRNIRRKSPGDIILSYKRFCDGLSKEQAKKCCLIMKTAVIDENGTDLNYVKRTICPKYKIVFIQDAVPTQQMNWIYNLSDCVLFLSSAEGFGLAMNEGMLSGRMVIAPVHGGLQDQMRFEDENGKWVDFNNEFPTNDRKTYFERYGEWAIPLFPTARALNGSVPTPAIFDDYVDAEDAAKAIRKVYDIHKEDRFRYGMLGRDWAMSQESGMSSVEMYNRFSNAMNKLFETWTPPESKWEIVNVSDRPVVDDAGIIWWDNTNEGQ